MTPVEGLTIFALVAGPISSVFVAQEMQKRAAVRNQRMSVFMSLLSTRTDRIGTEHLRSLSLIDVAFDRYPRVRQKWGAYYEALCNPGYGNENGAAVRLTKFNDMLAEMARALGYGKDIGFEEIGRVYIPQGLADNNALQQTAQTELIRVLRNSDNMGTARKGSGMRARITPENALALATGAFLSLIPMYLRRNRRPPQAKELPPPDDAPKG